MSVNSSPGRCPACKTPVPAKKVFCATCGTFLGPSWIYIVCSVALSAFLWLGCLTRLGPLGENEAGRFLVVVLVAVSGLTALVCSSPPNVRSIILAVLSLPAVCFNLLYVPLLSHLPPLTLSRLLDYAAYLGSALLFGGALGRALWPKPSHALRKMATVLFWLGLLVLASTMLVFVFAYDSLSL